MSKTFPDNYPADAVRILKTMAFNPKDVQIIGSMSLRSQLYAGDYDAQEQVKKPSAKRFQQIIKNLSKICWINGIKCGEKPELKPDYKGTRFEVIEAKKENKPHIVRWSVEDVMRGHKGDFTLEDGFRSGIVKVDVIGFVENNKYTDFSMNYYFKPETNKDFVKEIQDEIYYYNKVDPFKAMKREFSLAKFQHDTAKLNYLLPILNSDLGIIYSLRSDIGTLLDLHKSDSTVKFELDQMRIRMSHITLKEFVQNEPLLLKHLDKAIKTTNSKTLTTLYNDLNSYLS